MWRRLSGHTLPVSTMGTSTQSVITQRLLFVLAASACSTAPEIRWRGSLQNGLTREKWTRGTGNKIGVGRVFGECRARSLTPRGPAGTRRPALRPPPRLDGRPDGVFRRRLVSAGTDPTPRWDGRARRTRGVGARLRGLGGSRQVAASAIAPDVRRILDNNEPASQALSGVGVGIANRFTSDTVAIA